MKTKFKFFSFCIFLTLSFTIYWFGIDKSIERETTDTALNGIAKDVIVEEVQIATPKVSWSWDRNEIIENYELIHRSAFDLFYSQHKKFHDSITNDLINEEQKKWQTYTENMKIPDKKYKGRGIVYSGYPKTISQTIVSIRFHRYYGCNLPIEVWHYNELSADEISLFEKETGVKVKNMKDFLTEEIPREGGKLFAMKGAILIFTDFYEVLFMDSDNIPVADVSLLFETPAFKETGNLFWPDYWKTRCDNYIWQLLNLKCTNEYEQESGQILITKTPQVLKSLYLAFFFQRTQGIYSELLLGDKDTFRLSWRIIGVPYHMIRVNPAALGHNNNNQFCGVTMAQHAPMWGSAEDYGNPPIGYNDPKEPTIVFLHMNLRKYLSQALENPFAKTIQRFKPTVFPYGKYKFGPGLCCKLETCEDIADSCRIEQIPFNAVLADFEKIYESIIETVK